MKFDVLRASNKLDSQSWDSLIEALPIERRDIHFTSAYGRVQEKLGGEAVLAVLRIDDDSFIIQPFIKRQIPLHSRLSDLCSPYGYGGPVANFNLIVAYDMARRFFLEHLAMWCANERIITEFCYLHPLLLSHQRGFVTDEHIAKNVIIIDLNKFSEETIARRVRRGFKKARDVGSHVSEVSRIPAQQEQFAALYQSSMQRKCAAPRWSFSGEYLYEHYRELSARLFIAYDTAGLRMLMVIGGYGTAYAHLLASNGESLHSGLDELLYCHAAQALREDGYERFHLGGGLTADPQDRLLFFKSGFSPDRYKLASYTRVFNEQAYRDLGFEKIANEVDELGRESTSTRFPIYRRDTV